jgi:hypothetical protein
MNLEVDKNRVYCEECKRYFGSPQALYAHLRWKHQVEVKVIEKRDEQLKEIDKKLKELLVAVNASFMVENKQLKEIDGKLERVLEIDEKLEKVLSAVNMGFAILYEWIDRFTHFFDSSYFEELRRKFIMLKKSKKIEFPVSVVYSESE